MAGDIGFGMHPEGRPTSRYRMRNVDSLPKEFRLLVHQYGYAVWRLWLNGWSVEMIKACEKRDGTLNAKARRKRR